MKLTGTSQKKLVLGLIGPTAVGKTAVSIELARRLPTEIISADSMQIYRGMDIGTSKPPLSFRREIPHHLIDILNPDEDFNLSQFLQRVLELIPRINRSGKIPLIVGGSGLYIRVLTQGLFPGAGADWNLRRRLEGEARRKGMQFLYLRLRKLDPRAAAQIHPNNLRRIIRALEVYETTGTPISVWQEKTKGITGKYELKIFGLIREKKDLTRRIDRRVKAMFADGLVEEVKRLHAAGKLGTTAGQALGYREVIDCLEGEYSRDRAEELIKRNTRRFARRQMTWFRREKDVAWIEVAPDESAGHVAERILREVSTYQRGNVSMN